MTATDRDATAGGEIGERWQKVEAERTAERDGKSEKE